MALSTYVANIGREIEAKSGADMKFSHKITLPKLKWITEGELSKMKVVPLRTAEETKNGSAVDLQQFNPSSLLEDSIEIHCRISGCSATTRRLKPTHPSTKMKQDLFVCNTHHAKLMSLVSERCAKENVIVSFANFKNEDFTGYTTLIAECEKAFMFYQKKASTSILSTTDSLCAELFLNTRNFLLITNALLNPDEDNTTTALVPCLTLFNNCLSYLKDPDKLRNLLTVLREIVDMILLFFGVIYGWISLANPGGKVGAGFGLLLASVGGAMWAFPPAGIVFSSLVGLVAGGLIGSGGYEWYKDHHYMKMQQRHQEFMSDLLGQRVPPQSNLFPALGSAAGDLDLKLKRN